MQFVPRRLAGRRSRGRVPLSRACRRRRPDAACAKALEGALRPPRRQVPDRRVGRRPRHRQAVYAHNLGLPLIPASNEKLAVTYACLLALGPSFRFATDALGEGELDGSLWRGDIVLKGYGDPMLSTLDLLKLASQLHAQGIRRVSGQIVGDESFFDAKRMAPGWKPWYFINESAPLSALDRRPRPLPGPRHARPGAWPLRCRSEQRSLRAGISVAGRAMTGTADADGGPARDDRVGAARADPPLHGPRERQLHRRDPPQAARRRLRAPGHDRRRGRGRAPAPRPSSRSRSRACASWTARGSRGSTG